MEPLWAGCCPETFLPLLLLQCVMIGGEEKAVRVTRQIQALAEPDADKLRLFIFLALHPASLALLCNFRPNSVPGVASCMLQQLRRQGADFWMRMSYNAISLTQPLLDTLDKCELVTHLAILVGT